jgi:hypothetical protein
MKSQYQFGWETELYFWSDEAACKDADPKLFVTIERGSREAARMSEEDRLIINNENHLDALSYCDRCPVRQRCLEEADDSDLEWTVRGGNTPGSYSGKPVGRPSSRGLPKCGNGHVKEPGKQCPQCRLDQHKRYRDREKANRQALKAGRPLPFPGVGRKEFKKKVDGA